MADMPPALDPLLCWDFPEEQAESASAKPRADRGRIIMLAESITQLDTRVEREDSRLFRAFG
jgi:hypothetical protein